MQCSLVIFHDSCKKNIVLLSWGRSDNTLEELFCHTSLLIPATSLPTDNAISFLVVENGFRMAREEETMANFGLGKFRGLGSQLQLDV